MKKQTILIISSIIIIALATFVLWYLWDNQNNQKDQTSSQGEEQIATTSEENDQVATSSDEINENDLQSEVSTKDWKTYRNEEYGYSLRYPGEWKMTEYDYIQDELGSKQHVKGVAFRKNNYVLSFSYSHRKEDIFLNTRTGVSAGNFIELGRIRIGDFYLIENWLVYKNKVKEVFYKDSDFSDDLSISGELNEQLSPAIYYDDYELDKNIIREATEILKTFSYIN